MSFQLPFKPAQQQGPAFEHAVVIGGSIAGLLAAHRLSSYFSRVTIIERDRLPVTPGFRRGAPQARHAHHLPQQGQLLLEQQLPGILAELKAKGATFINENGQMSFMEDETWYDPVTSMACSRPLLENVIYRRVKARPNIELIEAHEVIELCINRSGQRVIGVKLRPRGLPSYPTILPANLVLDASGRGSPAPAWLATLGFTPPRETVVNAFSGYTSRIYRRPAQVSDNWHMLAVKRVPPDRLRGGMIIPLEENRWHVTLIGMARDYPPTDEAGFLAFAHSLPSARLYEAIKAAEPLSKVGGFRANESRLRHYEELPRYLEGFLVCGDAVHALSPVHAQGMTAAILDSQALESCLQAQRPQDRLPGLAQAFQQELHRVTGGVWQTVTDEDRRWPATEVIEKIEMSLRPRRQQPVQRPVSIPAAA